MVVPRKGWWKCRNRVHPEEGGEGGAQGKYGEGEAPVTLMIEDAPSNKYNDSGYDPNTLLDVGNKNWEI